MKDIQNCQTTQTAKQPFLKQRPWKIYRREISSRRYVFLHQDWFTKTSTQRQLACSIRGLPEWTLQAGLIVSSSYRSSGTGALGNKCRPAYRIAEIPVPKLSSLEADATSFATTWEIGSRCAVPRMYSCLMHAAGLHFPARSKGSCRRREPIYVMI